MTKNLGQCSVKVYGDWLVTPNCQKPATVERDGKLYCTIHDPEYIKAKQAKWHAKFDRGYAERREQDELLTAKKLATKGLTLQELRRVTPELIRKALAEQKSNR
jgi:hypothetical protein